MNSTLQITSVGMLAAELQRPVHVILATAKLLDVRPAAIVNRVTYFNESGIERIANYFRQHEGSDDE